ncbi:SEVEN TRANSMEMBRANE PROTEIN 1 [Salix purpurea]|uniref:SEVEN TRANSMEMBRANE PROTEIN 1 n=1 Tax=Salix purpurea TaxID=77065 RepID=A0A9Q1A3J3_SALPP|nr:lysosomal amino acid transporter [Salix suchowensis]KAJ6756612.1 SEVEN TRANSMEMBRANE PROTEIN 1 [Salix purpurea]
MGLLRSTMPMCPQYCSQWARIYMKYCLCSMKDGASLTLGVISVLSWGVAEIPQIITNYKKKSTEGLSLAFLFTWIVGDLFNVFGCMLEPATLPTQYYMAVLYAITTSVLTAQTVYYGHIYHRLKRNRRCIKAPISSQTEEAGRIRQGNSDAEAQVNNADKQRNETASPDGTNGSSSPIPFPTHTQKSSTGRELYYMSARSLSSSHTPTVGSSLAQRMASPSFSTRISIEEPLLGADVTTQSAPNLNTKTMLCVVSVVTLLGTLNLHQSANNRLDRAFENKHQGFVIQVGRKILQVSSRISHENGSDGSGIGTFLGWSMAAIYMGGRLPQIFLNIKRGNVEGLNPLMFVFALIGNITYVASILVDSMAWSKIRANLPWIVDAGGCVLLDTCILLQFIYFHHRRRQVLENKLLNYNSA